MEGDIDRDMSLAKNYIDRDISLDKNILTEIYLWLKIILTEISLPLTFPAKERISLQKQREVS